MNLQQKIEAILDKAVKLKEQNRKLVVRTETLETEVNTLKQQLEKEQQETQELRNKIKIIKLAQNLGSSNNDDAGIVELKKKLNEYIKEIDHCITMLNE